MQENPKEITDFREENLPGLIKTNTYNENEIYDNEDVKPAIGNEDDVAVRTDNIARNRYNESNRYTGPRRLP